MSEAAIEHGSTIMSQPPEPATRPAKAAMREALAQARASYTHRLPRSRAQHESATKFLPGGNTRSVLHNEPFPICMQRGRDNRLWDLDGNEYLDLVGEFTAGLYGHSNALLKQTVASTYEDVGISFGASTKQEVDLARLICERLPSIEQLRFCNSGTEANLYVLAVARQATQKRRIIAFKGAYHGGVLSFGHGGVAASTVDRGDWVLGTYNDVAGARKLIAESPDVAAVIVEAMQGAGGCIPGTVEFLRAIQTTAKQVRLPSLGHLNCAGCVTTDASILDQ
jgi:glutamate-1-semialdehyde 2,1-aminomutase